MANKLMDRNAPEHCDGCPHGMHCPNYAEDGRCMDMGAKLSDPKAPEHCDACPHQTYCPHYEDDGYTAYCANRDACADCGVEHGRYWDCQYGYDIRDGDAWGGFTGRSGG